MENKNVNSIDTHQIHRVESYQDKLMAQNIAFTEKVARIEAQQEATREYLSRIEQQMGGLHNTLTEEIRTSIGGRIQDIVDLQMQQQDVQNKIVGIQGRQGEQIDEIRKTLEEFTKIQGVISIHETKLATLEAKINAIDRKITKLDDVDKTRTQGKWALITAIASGLVGIVGSLLALLLK